MSIHMNVCWGKLATPFINILQYCVISVTLWIHSGYCHTILHPSGYYFIYKG